MQLRALASFCGAFRWDRLLRLYRSISHDRRKPKERQVRLANERRITPKTKKQEPTLYKVVLLNDDYTTMDFVILVLEDVFQKSPAEAFRIMIQVHVNGRGIAGVYPWEVAETKVETVSTMARDAGYPLRAALEEG